MNPTEKYDLAVAYRVCSHNSKHAPVKFLNDKFNLVKLCLESFKAATAGLRVKMFVILDGCPPDYEYLFRSSFDAKDLELIYARRHGNAATFREQVRILCEQTACELVYLAEDDYLYRPGALAEMAVTMREMISVPDFATPYDHPDYDSFSRTLHGLFKTTPRYVLRETGWRNRTSTTLTFMARRSSLKQCRALFESINYGNLMPDLALWMAVTKSHVFNPLAFVRWILTGKSFWAFSWLLAWWVGWKNIIAGKQFKLVAPTPSLATHAARGFIASGFA
jgi:hypothetical protein